MADKLDSYLGRWDEYLSYDLDPPRLNRTLCQYLQVTGMDPGPQREVMVRAYVDWIMRYYYSGILSHWGLAQQIPEVRNRTLIVCYEDLMSRDTDVQTVRSIVNFFFNGDPPMAWQGTPPGHVNYTGGHSTNHDERIKEGLVELIKQVDVKYYNEEIAWANSILPC